MISGHQFLGYDEGKQTLGWYDTDRPGQGWTLDLTPLPLARDLQRIGPNLALVGFDRGFFEVEISSGRVMTIVDHWKGVTSVYRRTDGATLVTGVNLEGATGVTVLTVDPSGLVISVAQRDGDYVRLLRPTATDTYLLCTNDHILETDTNLKEIRKLVAPGFYHAWMPHRFADGTTLVSGGYGGFMAFFDAQGQLTKTFGAKGEVPTEIDPHFYATFEVLPGGHILAVNWQGHGPDNGTKGRQLVEFTPDGTCLGGWSDPDRISSLQGILIL